MKLPKGWIAPRKEFCIAGFHGEIHIYGFDAAPVAVTSVKRGKWKSKTKTVSGAQCRECDGLMLPDNERLVEHAKLHLAVKLAKEAMQLAK